MANEGGNGFEVPGFVLDELEANPALVRRWLEDAAFRQAILEGEDPSTVASEHGLTVSREMSDWIAERVRAHGAALLQGAAGPIVAA